MGSAIRRLTRTDEYAVRDALGSTVLQPASQQNGRVDYRHLRKSSPPGTRSPFVRRAVRQDSLR